MSSDPKYIKYESTCKKCKKNNPAPFSVKGWCTQCNTFYHSQEERNKRRDQKMIKNSKTHYAMPRMFQAPKAGELPPNPEKLFQPPKASELPDPNKLKFTKYEGGKRRRRKRTERKRRRRCSKKRRRRRCTKKKRRRRR